MGIDEFMTIKSPSSAAEVYIALANGIIDPMVESIGYVRDAEGRIVVKEQPAYCMLDEDKNGVQKVVIAPRTISDYNSIVKSEDYILFNPFTSFSQANKFIQMFVYMAETIIEDLGEPNQMLLIWQNVWVDKSNIDDPNEKDYEGNPVFAPKDTKLASLEIMDPTYGCKRYSIATTDLSGNVKTVIGSYASDDECIGMIGAILSYLAAKDSHLENIFIKLMAKVVRFINAFRKKRISEAKAKDNILKSVQELYMPEEEIDLYLKKCNEAVDLSLLSLNEIPNFVVMDKKFDRTMTLLPWEMAQNPDKMKPRVYMDLEQVYDQNKDIFDQMDPNDDIMYY